MTEAENALQHSQFRELTLLELGEPGSATNAIRALTHSSDSSREGLAVNATHTSPERWLPVVGWEGYYEVSSIGNVRSVDRMVNNARGNGQHMRRGRSKALLVIPSGHCVTGLSRHNRRVTAKVHRLVLIAFGGPAPSGTECCHNNGIPSDNRIENLRWDSTSANRRDCVNHGTHKNASKTHCMRGHEFTPENTYIKPGNNRQCRTCAIDYARRQRAARQVV